MNNNNDKIFQNYVNNLLKVMILFQQMKKFKMMTKKNYLSINKNKNLRIL